MHLIEAYATNTGLKINKPDLYVKYYPVPFKNYIVFHPQSKESKTYDYWSEVLDLIVPHLSSAGIGIIQIGSANDLRYDAVYSKDMISLNGRLSFPQVNYLIYNSKLVFGADSFSSHSASTFGKKIVCLYTNNNINNVRPYWSKEEDVSLIEPKREAGHKPYYATSVPLEFKEINKIKPETIAYAILTKLGFSNVKIRMKTEYLGTEYKNRVLELVPNNVVPPIQLGVEQIVVRMDYEFNEEILDKQLKTGRAIIYTDKPIDLKLLVENKLRISQLIYKIKPGFDLNFVKNLSYVGINHVFLSYESGEELDNIKLNLMGYGFLFLKEKKLVKSVLSSSYQAFYKNGKCILSGGKVYPSFYALKRNLPMREIGVGSFRLDDIETCDFDEDIEHYCFYRNVD